MDNGFVIRIETAYEKCCTSGARLVYPLLDGLPFLSARGRRIVLASGQLLGRFDNYGGWLFLFCQQFGGGLSLHEIRFGQVCGIRGRNVLARPVRIAGE